MPGSPENGGPPDSIPPPPHGGEATSRPMPIFTFAKILNFVEFLAPPELAAHLRTSRKVDLALDAAHPWNRHAVIATLAGSGHYLGHLDLESGEMVAPVLDTYDLRATLAPAFDRGPGRYFGYLRIDGFPKSPAGPAT